MTASGYDPIAILMEEHRMYLRRLTEIRTDLQRLSGASRDRLGVPSSLTTFADFLATDVDGFHGRKEEEGLFPVLVRHVGLDGGPVEVMLEEHELLRHHQKTIAGSVPRLETDPGRVDALSAVSVALDSIHRLLANHIDKEDEVLFPMARATLTPAEMSEVAQVCLEIEDRFGDRVRASRRSPRDAL
ncbi:MAG TPA: hemerythrin domain-containing protein [Thermoplasmata archaeon]|nr:hemerythrin domain-containing protein [Thermoplasmata archaeon]